MIPFPVTSSNLSAAHLGKFLDEKYELSTGSKCTFIRAGINHTYLLTASSSKAIFRVYSFDWRSKEEITEEIKLLNLLKQSNLPVSYPLADRAGNYIQVLPAPEGERFGVMFTYAEGQKVHDLSAKAHYDIGAVMARLHLATTNLKLNRVTYTPKVLLLESMVFLQKFLPAGSAEMDFMYRTQQDLLDVLANVDKRQVREGIVHLDFWFDNLNVTTDNQITLFDFDFCGNGLLALDIAYYIMQLYNIERYDENGYGPKVKSFLDGYESVTRLSKEERRLIPSLGICLYFFYLGVQCQRYENWSNSFLSENYLKRYINGIIKRYLDLTKMTSDS
jgi:Ser/Thr protein kinase RdoA (MazF antagonist)